LYGAFEAWKYEGIAVYISNKPISEEMAAKIE
jgi:hypothetical protein